MALNKVKVEKYLSDYKKIDYKKLGEDLLFHPAICYLQLGNFEEAEKLFKVSLHSMLAPPYRWRFGGAPENLVDVFVLSASNQYSRDIQSHLEDYKKKPPGNPSAAFAYIALYAYSIIEMLFPSGTPIDEYIEGLLRRPKIKDGYAMGQTLRAILEKDQNFFNDGLKNLLNAHEKMAKYGGLRETAEGFLCMSAMTLAYIALRNGMHVEFKNDYLSIEYLNFLLFQEKS